MARQTRLRTDIIERERAISARILKGESNSALAIAFGLSMRTIQQTRKRINERKERWLTRHAGALVASNVGRLLEIAEHHTERALDEQNGNDFKNAKAATDAMAELYKEVRPSPSNAGAPTLIEIRIGVPESPPITVLPVTPTPKLLSSQNYSSANQT